MSSNQHQGNPGSVDGLPAADKHGDLQPVIDGVHYVEGTFRKFPILSFARGMTIIRCNPNEIAVVNAVRLSDNGERALLELGIVAHVIRLGMHDMDDAYYVRKFGATYWTFSSVDHANDLHVDKDLSVDGLPLSDARLIQFPHLPPKFAEAAILLHRPEGNVLITCDSVQNHDPVHGSLLARVVMPFMGFRGRSIFGPIWMKIVTKEMNDPTQLQHDLSVLRDIDFQYLLSGHGMLVDGTAKESLLASFAKTFPDISLES